MSQDTGKYREEIDKVDEQLVRLFAERMDISAKIAKIKQKNHLPIFDKRREREKILDVMKQSPEEIREYTSVLYSLLFELSRSYQERLTFERTGLT